MEYRNWQEFAEAAKAAWKQGKITYTDYWMCVHLAKGNDVTKNRKRGKMDISEILESTSRILKALQVDYLQELSEMEKEKRR